MKKSRCYASFLRSVTDTKVNPICIFVSLLYGHYRVAYLIKEDQTIDILGVFHGALDIDRYLP